MALRVREMMALELAGRRYKYEAVRDDHARQVLGLTPPKFRQLVNAAIDKPEALEHDPQLVRRLLRLREVRRALRRSA